MEWTALTASEAFHAAHSAMAADLPVAETRLAGQKLVHQTVSIRL